MTDSLVQLGQYGTIGIMLALIGLVGLVGYLFYKFASNHVEHSNEAFKDVSQSNVEVAKAMTELKDVINYKLK